MKKFFLVLIICMFSIGSALASYEEEQIYNFMYSPSYADLEKIQDPLLRFCETVYLDAYMRRPFTDFENFICSDIFEMKMEAEILYKKSMLQSRFVY